MLKLFIAVILQAYNDIKIKQSRLFNNQILQTFKENWKEFDPEVSINVKFDFQLLFIIILMMAAA